MKKILIIFITACVFLNTSCTSHLAVYSVSLKTVECPKAVNKQFGETKVVTYDDGNITKYRYEDDYIEITWFVSLSRFNFELKNKSDYTIKINWDDISYVDIENKSGRVIHAGVKYADRSRSQVSTVLAKNTKISDMLLPVDNVYYKPYNGFSFGGWGEANLIPSYYKTKKDLNKFAPLYIGQKMKILMPILIENVQNDYIFEFVIDDWK
ncbi:MAG: hypothetical protein J6J76_04345 [Paraprevotella sp.]|nr:hypothetical protein [Paraprevotella sp.]